MIFEGCADDPLFYIYYSILAVTGIMYVKFARMLSIKWYSGSNLSMVYLLVFFGLGGYFVASGASINMLNSNFGLGMNYQLYLIYLAGTLCAGLGVLLGNALARKCYLKICTKKSYPNKLGLVSMILIVYLCYYIAWAPIIPFNELIVGSRDAYDLVMMRITMTHSFGQIDPPFLLRYWQLVGFTLLPAIAYTYVARYFIKKSSTEIVFPIMLSIFISYLSIMNLEKARLIYYIIGVYLTFIVVSHIVQKRSATPSLHLIVALLLSFLITIIYKGFAGIANISDAFDSVVERIFSQSASDYIMYEYYESHGPYFLSNIRIPILSLFDWYSYVDLSKEAIKEIYPDYNSSESSGAAGGFSLSELVYSFGWFGPCVYVALVTIYGFVDKLFLNSIEKTTSDIVELQIGFYVSFVMSNITIIGSSVWTMFSISTLLSLPNVLCFILFLLLVGNGRIPFLHLVRSNSFR